MAFHGLPMTGSGVKDCEGCGDHVMVSDLSKPAYCGDGECVADPSDVEPEECSTCRGTGLKGNAANDDCDDCDGLGTI